MPSTGKRGVKYIRRILHPTDFSTGSEKAFLHALRIALGGDGQLTILHAETEEDELEGDPLSAFPSVGATLDRWRKHSPSEGTSPLKHRRVDVLKLSAVQRDPIRSAIDYAEDHLIDLVVLATQAREGLPRLLRGSVAEPLTRKVNAPALFLPPEAQGFVDPDSGAAAINRVLLPITTRPSPESALAVVEILTATLGLEALEIDILHVSEEEVAPDRPIPGHLPCNWMQRKGPVVETIIAVAKEQGSALIVMATEGHHGFLDALRGSTTERVLRKANLPVLAVPSPRPE